MTHSTTTTVRELAAHINADHLLVGRSTEPALRTLMRLPVRQAFERLARAQHEGSLEIDNVDVQVVRLAHAVRAAVAHRWGRAGASTLEQRLAADVDRTLGPFRDAVLVPDDADFMEEWLDELWLQGADIDTEAWWGFQFSIEWMETRDGLRFALDAIAGELAFPARRPRHEEAWDPELNCFPDDWREIRYNRLEKDDYLMAELAWEYEDSLERDAEAWLSRHFPR